RRLASRSPDHHRNGRRSTGVRAPPNTGELGFPSRRSPTTPHGPTPIRADHQWRPVRTLHHRAFPHRGGSGVRTAAHLPVQGAAGTPASTFPVGLPTCAATAP